jgi:WS/DGAT/MGAT family acyltransferase
MAVEPPVAPVQGVTAVPERLTSLDVSFLYLEEPTTPMHIGGVAVLLPGPEGFGADRLARIVADRLGRVPRYRQKVRQVPAALGRPVWVDDAAFDLSFHLRHERLPEPGGDAELCALVGRLMAEPLDRSRPLWEVHLVEGLAGGRVALVAKTHHAMVDGVAAGDLAQAILDADPDAGPNGRPAATAGWRPEPEPGPAELVFDAVTDLVARPSEILDTARAALVDARATAGRAWGAASGLVAAARTAARPAPPSPLNPEIGGGRRFAIARTTLDSYRTVRARHGGTVNDVVLATVAGALREWLLSRGAPVGPTSVLRALVPLSVRPPGRAKPVDRDGGDAVVTPFLVDLPVGEPDPAVRLMQISYALRAHQEAGRSVPADALVRFSGATPSTLHSLGARTASVLSRRLFNLVVNNVPGPQSTLYAGGARLLEVFPVVPLARSQAVAIGLTSYDGGVYYGLNADRDTMPDVDVLAALLPEALAELAGPS